MFLQNIKNKNKQVKDLYTVFGFKKINNGEESRKYKLYLMNINPLNRIYKSFISKLKIMLDIEKRIIFIMSGI